VRNILDDFVARHGFGTGRRDDDVPAYRGYTFGGLDTRTFLHSAAPPRWLVKNLLVANQLGLVCGAKKTLKTSLLIDLTLSLGTGTPFLGHFHTYGPVRVAFLSGESGHWTIKETAVRVAKAKGIDPASASCWWDFRLPQLASLADTDELRRGLDRNGIRVLVLDPLYLALLAGTELSAENMFHTGPLLMRVAETCLGIGCTPVLCHHYRKNLKEPFEPGNLEDIAYSGFQEAARQWWLINRREPHEPGSGEHRLWLSAGGSVGHAGCWAVDVSEGRLAEDFSGRTWQVSVVGAGEARQELAEKGDSQKQLSEEKKDKGDDARILNAIDFLSRAEPDGRDRKLPAAEGGPAFSRNQVQIQSKLSHARGERAVERLLTAGHIEEVEITIWSGRGHKVVQRKLGIRRKPATAPTDPTDLFSPWCTRPVGSGGQ
jgi:hypothetical protein